MKTIINKFFLVSAVVMALTACSDFLDKEPLSQGTEAIVFKTPEHFEQAANALYNVIGWKNLDDKPSYDDIMDRGTDISGLGSNGGGSAPEENWSWDKPYSHIRTCNILLEKAEAYDGSHSASDQLDSADSVVVAGDDVVDLVGVAVGINDSNDGDVQLASLSNSDALLVGVNDEHGLGQGLHVLDAAEVLVQLLHQIGRAHV